MRVLVTGGRGLLGAEVEKELEIAGHEALVFGHELDVSDPTSMARIGASEFGHLDWVINCAAYTAVDKAESEEREAYETNALALSYLGQACSSARVKLLHVSTDFVFDGKSDRPYVEDDPTGPINVYGKTKLAGEKAISGNHLAVTVRTSWLFGPRGKCFPRSIIAAFDAGKTLNVVDDQWGTPTYTPHLAKRLVQVIKKDPFPGVYHLSGGDVLNWFQFAQSALKAAGRDWTLVNPIPTSGYPTPAERPKYSVLNSDRILKEGIEPFPDFEEAIQEFCASLK